MPGDMPLRCLPLGFLAVAAAAAAVPSPGQTLLAEWPMVMAHDSATTYLEGGSLHVINRWTKTQADGGFAGLLDCGARAFDLRPGPVTGDSVFAHHGPVTIKHEVSQMLDEVVQWAASHTDGAGDLVLLGVTEVGDAKSNLQAMLAARNITYYTDCPSLKSLRVVDAVEKSKLPGGGYVMAIFDCWVENYDPSIACSGFRGADGRDVPWSQEDGSVPNAEVYTCYNDSNTKDFPLNRMYAYIDKVLAVGPPSDGRLYSVQALWQESGASIFVGGLHGSSLLDDEVRSGLNRLLAERIREGAVDVRRLGMLEVNNVCDSSHELIAAIHQRRNATASEYAGQMLLV